VYRDGCAYPHTIGPRSRAALLLFFLDYASGGLSGLAVELWLYAY
jgi:hypothetical protein